MVHIKVSKTLPRSIGIPFATKMLNEWLKEHPAINDKEEFLFPTTYDYYRKLLRIESKKVLGQVITPHQLRHSSATHYSKLPIGNNFYRFCYRYGWSLNSDMPTRYIEREKLKDEAEELDNVIKNSKILELEEENKMMRRQIELINKQLGLAQDQGKGVPINVIASAYKN